MEVQPAFFGVGGVYRLFGVVAGLLGQAVGAGHGVTAVENTDARAGAVVTRLSHGCKIAARVVQRKTGIADKK